MRDENQPALPQQTRPGDWALGWWDLGATRDRPVRPGMPGLALPETLPGPGTGTGEGFGMPQTRPGGLGGGGIVRYMYELLARTLAHVI